MKELVPFELTAEYRDRFQEALNDHDADFIRQTLEEVNAAMKAAANESFGYTEDEIVSSDIVGIRYGSLYDATQTRVISNGDQQLVKTVSWYDNEMSYVSQLVRSLHYFAKLISK